MKFTTVLLATLALASTAFAGEATYSAKNSKAVAPVQQAIGCDCFAPGAAFGIFGAGIIQDGDNDEDDALGGGVLAEYFFTDMIGVQGSYGIFATDSEHHEFDAALVVRFPITEACIAPYIMGGGGFATNSDDAWNVFVGGGIDIRFPDANCFGIFADGAYHWSEDDDDNFTLVRVGVKFRL
jgi:hypothetical protein